MKILYLSTLSGHFSADFILSGLCKVIEKENIVLHPIKVQLNCSNKDIKWSILNLNLGFTKNHHETEIVDLINAGYFDYVMIAAVREQRHTHASIFQRIRTRPKVIAIDGEDSSQNYKKYFEEISGYPCWLYLKRECLDANCGIPFPMCIPEERVLDQSKEKLFDVAFICGTTHPDRRTIADTLRSMPRLKSVILLDQFLPYPSYREIISRSKISINVRGAGVDCMRYWEIPAYFSMLMSQKNDLIIPDNFRDGKEAVFFDMDDLKDKLLYYLSDDKLRKEVTTAGHTHLLTHHTDRKRAEYLLDIIKQKETSQ